MQYPNAEQEWEQYRERELHAVMPLLEKLGYELEKEQPHAGGERYLMQAVTTASGKKLILLGRRKSDNLRVVIKTTNDSAGIRELEHERKCRRVLEKINFAYQTFLAPQELLYNNHNGRLISIQVFIEQKSSFLARPLPEQFALALRAFKTQESAHATTYGHERLIESTFGTMHADDYLKNFETFRTNISRHEPRLVLDSFLGEAARFLAENCATIEQYSGFLTHTDFVPHNIRVSDDHIYLLDHSSLRFGNKYEGWARFVNFMTLYNPPLADTLIEYVHSNRPSEESLALKLMRVYRLGEIIWYYVNTLDKCGEDLCTLNTERVKFWTRVLTAVLHDERVPPEALTQYRDRRDALRSEEEKKRQKDLH